MAMIFRLRKLDVLLTATLLGCAGSGVGAQGLERCRPVEAFLISDRGMVVEVEPDTIDDWRTHEMLPGCRVTAAGGTERKLGAEAELLYTRLLETGWVRTPDPRDAPNEAALRFRLGETDCFFNAYDHFTSIGTAAERRVGTAVQLRPGENRYNLLVQCVEAKDAAPR